MTTVITQQPVGSTAKLDTDHTFSVAAVADLRILDADYDGETLNSIGNLASFTTTSTQAATKFSSSSFEYAADTSKRVTIAGEYFDFATSASWSFEGWIYPTAIGTNSLPIIHAYQSTSGAFNYWNLEVNTSGNIQIRSRNQFVSEITRVGNTVMSNNNWYYIAVYVENNQTWVFVDGVPQTNLSNVNPDLPNPAGTTQLWIGADNNTGFGFNGYMDDLRYVYGDQAFDYAGSGNIPVPTAKLPGDPIIDPGATVSYEWFVDDAPQFDSNSTTFTLTASTTNSYSRVYAVASSSLGSSATSNTVFAVTEVGSSLTKHALLWNYNNNTFSWKDPAVEQLQDAEYQLFNTDYQTYGFAPGYQQRWEDWKQGAYYESTWEGDTTNAWSDTLFKSSEREMILISQGQAFKAEKIRNRSNSLKKYFVERTQIDFDGLSPEFRSGKVKQTKRFVIDVQADQRQISRGSSNTINFHVGWSMNLMDDPNYKTPIVFDLQAREFGGSYKVDYRSSGRYMGMYFDLTNSSQLSFTGGEVEVSQTSGR